MAPTGKVVAQAIAKAASSPHPHTTPLTKQTSTKLSSQMSLNVPVPERGSPFHRNLGRKPLKVAPGVSRPQYRDSPKFSQAVQLSDGSAFFVKSSSPRWLVALTKDTRNMLLWNPRLRNQRKDSGPVLDFKAKFGDLDSFGLEEYDPSANQSAQAPPKKKVQEQEAPAKGKGGKKGGKK